jgi:hypothetical protein
LTWTPGKAPSNSGNAAVDGSVTVVAPGELVVSDLVPPTTERTEVVHAKVVDTVRKVTAANQSVVASPVTSAVLVVPLASVEAPTPIENTIAANISAPLPSPLAAIQSETSVLTVSPTSTSEVIQATPVAPSQAKSSDPGAGLSLAALGNYKVTPVVSTAPASVKPSTNVLDELYRQLGATPLNGYNVDGTAGATTDESSDVWELEIFLADLDSQSNTDEVVPQ